MNSVGSIWEMLLKEVKQSAYIRWIIKQRNILLLAICISAFLTILTYPGILYSDSYVRIELADKIDLILSSIISEEFGFEVVYAWLTVVPSLFILLSKKIVGSISLYTFFQSFMFWFSVLVFSDQINKKSHQKWGRVCLLLSPVLWAYSVYYEASVGCVTAVIVMLLLIWKWRCLSTRFDKVLSLLLLVFASFVCFGYRANAFSIIPVVIVIIFLREKQLVSRLLLTVAIILGLTGTMTIPILLRIDTMSSYSAGFAWEIVSTIQSMDQEKQDEYIQYLDDLFGDGATAEAVKVNGLASINPMFKSPINQITVSSQGNSAKVISRYFELALKEPEAFLKNKLKFISFSLGISRPIYMAEYDYNRWKMMNSFGFNDSFARQTFVNGFNGYMEFMRVFRRPWIMYVFCLVLIIFWKIKVRGKTSEFSLCEAAFGVAVFYYGVFLLNTQSFEFRYFFPAWLLLVVISIGLISQLIIDNKHIGRIIFVSYLVITAVSFIGGYMEYIKPGNEMLSVLDKDGNILFYENGRKVIYYDNALYFVTERSVNNSFAYFLHFYLDDGEMINSDFVYYDNIVPTSLLDKSVAVIEVPQGKISYLEFGQFFEDTRLWEYELLMEDYFECPKEVTVSDYSDGNWACGYCLTDNCFLIEDSEFDNYYLIGKDIVDSNGNSYTVTNIEGIPVREQDIVDNKQNGYLIIYVDMPITDKTIRSYGVK